MTDNRAHSKLGASSMYRWSACPGSVVKCEGIVKKSSTYADEGSDAHELASVLLKVRRGCAAEYIGKTMSRDATHFVVTKDMADAVDVYLDAVRKDWQAHCDVKIEHQFDLSSVHPGCFGTADAVIWDPATKILHVFDYKHGAGIPVSPINNPQLMYYGLGALLTSSFPAEKVRLVIVQPRCGDPEFAVKEFTIDAIDLVDFRGELKQYALATENPDAPLNPGDHCRFCPAAPTCEALLKRTQDITKLEFAPALSYDPEKLKLALDSRPFVQAWLKTLDEFAYAEAEKGVKIPGYKLVEKKGNRKWRDEVLVEKELLEKGFKKDDIFEQPSLKSPAQMEKVKGLKNAITTYVHNPSSGHALVVDSDPRPPLKLSAREEFTIVEGVTK